MGSRVTAEENRLAMKSALVYGCFECRDLFALDTKYEPLAGSIHTDVHSILDIPKADTNCWHPKCPSLRIFEVAVMMTEESIIRYFV